MSNVVALRPAHDGTTEYVSRLRDMTPPTFLVDAIPPDPDGRYSMPPCCVPGCERVALRSEPPGCRVCVDAWRASRIATWSAFASSRTPSPIRRKGQGGDVARGIFRLSDVHSPVVRAELSWALARRAESSSPHGPMRAGAFNIMVNAIAESGVASILDLRDGTPQRAALVAACGSSSSSAVGFLNGAITDIDSILFGRIRGGAIGVRRGGSLRYSHADRIQQDWLRDLVERWVGYRKNTEAASAQHIGQQEASLVLFADWCVSQRVRGAADITRPLLLKWLGYVQELTNPKTGKQFSAAHRRKHIGAVDNFVTIARAEFDAPIPPNARYLAGERPEREIPNPRFLEPRVIARLRDESSLALIEDENHRLIIRILIHTGVRVGHTCALAFDSLLDMNRNGSDDKWSLRVLDTKSRKVVTLPISPELARAIRAHQEAVRARNEELGLKPSSLLFPNPRAYRSGQVPPERVNKTLAVWVRQLDLKEADGTYVTVTPHRFRHTFATEMREKGVPIEIIKELLGHSSIANTMVYATMTDARLREEWEKATIVDIHGEAIGLRDGEAGDAEWLLHRLGQAIQPLPNGYCGLPVQQECPHANACLDCDNFSTSAAFIDVLKAQHREHARFVSKAEAAGHLRIAEINRRPMVNLERIIKSVEGEAR